MKIACIIHSLSGGGAERVIASLASRLAQRDHHVTLITLDRPRPGDHAIGPDVQRISLDLMADSRGRWAGMLNTRRRIGALRRAIEQVSPQVALSFCDRTNVLALMAVRGRSVPLVISERSDPSQQSLGPVWEALRRRHYRRAARIVALTESAGDFLRRQTGNQVTVIPSAVDPPPISLDRTTAETNRRIVAVGRLAPEKGFDRLLHAFSDLSIRAAGPVADWTLRIVGAGAAEADLRRLTDQLGLTERVTFPGWISPIWSELSAATIFALPSRYEGFPSALLEAMAAGVPCVAVDCPSGPRAIIRNEVDGLLVADHTAALTDGLLHLITDTALRRRLGERGPEVVDRFGWKPLVDAYEQVLAAAATQVVGAAPARVTTPRHESGSESDG